MSSDWIPSEEWKIIVRNVPIVSVDLVVRSSEGIVLGKRTNEPAKGEWFTPGGRLRKHEPLAGAVERIAAEEIGVKKVDIQESLGVYEHMYDTADVEAGGGKHYIANGFVVETDKTVEQMTFDNQHRDIRAFRLGSLPSDLHDYVASYLRDAESIPYPMQEEL